VLSIILTSFNRPALLKKAVQSVLNQTESQLQLIIADDNSSKPEVDEIIALAAEDPRVFAWKSSVSDEDRPKQVRPSIMINESYQHVKGDLIFYLCDDCWMFPNCAQVVEDFFNANPQANGAYCIQELKWVDMSTGQELDKGITYRGDYGKPLTKAFCAVDHSQVFHRKTMLDKGLRWDTNPFNWKAPDGITFDKLIELGGPLYFIPKVLVGYYFHVHNLSRSDPTKVESFRW